MGEAILCGLLGGGLVSPNQIMAAEPRLDRRDDLHARFKIAVSDDNLEVTRWGKIVIFAVKPQILPSLLPPLQHGLHEDDVCLSIAAGVPLETYIKLLHHKAVIRAMPNTPAQIGKGMTVWTASPAVRDEHLTQARAIFGALGSEVFVEHEHYLDMATAISGSGPAYIFLLLEAMIDAAVHLGFSRQVAQQLVFQTVIGSAEYAEQSDAHVAQLRNQVTSPGGTTAAALNMLERGGLRTTVSDAIWAAYHRSCELGSKE